MTLGFYRCAKCNAPLGTIQPRECPFCGGPAETMWTVQPPWESLGNMGQPSPSATGPAQRSVAIPPSAAAAIYQMFLSNLFMTNAVNSLINSMPAGADSEKAPPWYPANLPWPPKKPWE